MTADEAIFKMKEGERIMSNDTVVTDFVDGLDSDALLVWCDIMDVPHNVDDWRGVDETLDDDHPDKTEDLRIALIAKFLLTKADTDVRECTKCGNEADCIEGVCQSCVLAREMPISSVDLTRHIAKGEQRK